LPTKQQIAGDTFIAVVVNRSTPTHVVNHLAEPHDRVQTVLHVSGEAPLLLG